jgi:MFS family permease
LSAYAAFRSRDFRLYFSGNLLSNFGLQMLSVAVSWDLYVHTKSPVVLGNVGFAQVAPFLLFSLPAGQFADRHDRRRIMIGTQIFVILAALFLALAQPSVLLIYSVLFLMAAARAFQGPARLASLARLVPRDSLRNAITWNSSTIELANVGGPALAGLLLAVAGSRTVYLIQLACAVLTIGCYQMMRVPASNDDRLNAPDRLAFLEGVRFVRHDPLILPAISLDLFAVLFGGATALLPIFAVEILHTDARGLGWLRAAQSLGAVAMALMLTRVRKWRHPGRTLFWTVAGFGAATIAFGLSRWFWLSFVMLVLTGAFDNVSVVLRQSLIQLRTPDHLKGRVLSVQSIFVSSSNQLGAVESGWTAAWLGAIGSVVGGGIATIAIVAGFYWRSKALRRWTQ